MKYLKADFLEFQEDCLEDWDSFCEKYQKLTPGQIDEVHEYFILDSVTVPVAPMADSGSVPSAPNKLNGWLVVSYRLDWIDAWEPKAVESVEVIPAAWEYYFSKIGFEPDSEYEWGSGNLHYCYEWKNTLSFEEKRLTRNPEENPELERAKGKIKQFRDFQNDCIESWDLFLESYRHLTQEQIQRARKHFFYNPDVVLVPSAPMANPGTVSATDLQEAPADTEKTKKRTNLTPDKKMEIIDYAGRNPGATYKDLAERFKLSDEPFRKGKPLRRAVDLERTGNLGRHAEKSDTLVNDKNNQKRLDRQKAKTINSYYKQDEKKI